MLRARFFNAAHTRGAVFQQLLESLEALACGQFLGFGRRDARCASIR